MTATSTDERQPLLQDDSSLDGIAPSGNPIHVKEGRLGPWEITRSTRAGILAGIWMGMFLGSVNTTMAATLISSISSEYNRSNQASWLGTSYLLAACTFTPLYGRLCDVLGRRGANQVAVVFATMGALTCSLSNSMEMLIAARFLSGMGGGGIFTTAAIITSDMYTMRERSMVQGFAAVFNGVGLSLGGPLGGWISDHHGWRRAFLIQLPFFALSLFLTSVNLTYDTPTRGRSTRDILKRIDYGGCLALFTGVGALLCFLSFKYNQDHDWDSAPVVTSLVVMGAAAVAFVFIELKVAYEPMLAPSLLRQSVPVIVGCSTGLISMCNFATMYFFPVWFETVQLQSASVAGAHLLPHSASISLGFLVVGWYMARTGRYKTLKNVFGLFPCAAALLIYRLREDSTKFAQWCSILPMGFGNAVVLQTTLICLLAAIGNSALAVGTGFTELFRGVGQLMGVAVSSALFQSILDRELRVRITGEHAAEYIIRIRHSTKLVAHLEPHIQRPARDSYAVALRYVFLYAAICSVISFIICLWLPELSLDQPLDSETHAPPTSAAGANSEGTIDERVGTVAVRPMFQPQTRRLSSLESGEGIDPK